MPRKAWIGLAVACAALCIRCFYPQVYLVRGEGGGELYWNADRALLVMSESSDGAHMSYLHLAAGAFLLKIGQTHGVDDTACSDMLIIQISAKDVQTFNTHIPGGNRTDCMGGLQLFDKNFYAVRWPILWKWSGGTTFERPTPDEYGAYARDFDARTLPGESSKTPWQFDDVNGWSMRSLSATKPPINITLSGQPVSVVFRGRTWPPRPLSVELVRPGQPPQTLWTFDEEPHRVTKVEYRKLFPPHD